MLCLLLLLLLYQILQYHFFFHHSDPNKRIIIFALDKHLRLLGKAKEWFMVRIVLLKSVPSIRNTYVQSIVNSDYNIWSISVFAGRHIQSGPIPILPDLHDQYRTWGIQPSSVLGLPWTSHSWHLSGFAACHPHEISGARHPDGTQDHLYRLWGGHDLGKSAKMSDWLFF